ncbi:hypothetical protein SAMD00023353_9600090 [Rosellinia necatrix]|uniref:Uncharacterized protein n=1 Tax=Rosellinia necatrix TaxID=77044 RepID=A0A1S8ABG8_ROSNE|nr:hypothetical protein SAMD00023353_9600090 [Rosellinia necatrix]
MCDSDESAQMHQLTTVRGGDAEEADEASVSTNQATRRWVSLSQRQSSDTNKGSSITYGCYCCIGEVGCHHRMIEQEDISNHARPSGTWARAEVAYPTSDTQAPHPGAIFAWNEVAVVIIMVGAGAAVAIVVISRFFVVVGVKFV